MQETLALSWIKENTPSDSTVLGTLNQGDIIKAIANRKNVLDTNFLLANNPSQRAYDIERIYKTQYKTEAIALLNKYDINYILFSNQTKSKFKIDKINYINDKKCFALIYDQEVKIYKSLCKLQQT